MTSTTRQEKDFASPFVVLLILLHIIYYTSLSMCIFYSLYLPLLILTDDHAFKNRKKSQQKINRSELEITRYANKLCTHVMSYTINHPLKTLFCSPFTILCKKISTKKSVLFNCSILLILFFKSQV